MISNESFDWLRQVSNGLLTKAVVQQLQLPDSTEVNQLKYLATRLQPMPQQFQFQSVDEARQSLAEYFACQLKAKAKVSAKSNRAIEALLLADTDKLGVSVNPWTYGAPLKHATD